MFSGGAEGAEALIVSVDAQLKASKWVDHRARCQCSLMPEQRWKSTYNPPLQANIFLHCPFPCNSPASASPSFSKELPHRFIFCSIVWRSFEIHPRFVEMGMVIRSAHRLLLFFDVEFRVSKLWRLKWKQNKEFDFVMTVEIVANAREGLKILALQLVKFLSQQDE